MIWIVVLLTQVNVKSGIPDGVNRNGKVDIFDSIHCESK